MCDFSPPPELAEICDPWSKRQSRGAYYPDVIKNWKWIVTATSRLDRSQSEDSKDSSTQMLACPEVVDHINSQHTPTDRQGIWGFSLHQVALPASVLLVRILNHTLPIWILHTVLSPTGTLHTINLSIRINKSINHITKIQPRSNVPGNRKENEITWNQTGVWPSAPEITPDGRHE